MDNTSLPATASSRSLLTLPAHLLRAISEFVSAWQDLLRLSFTCHDGRLSPLLLQEFEAVSALTTSGSLNRRWMERCLLRERKGGLLSLDFTGCGGLADVSAISECVSLHTLNLSYCHNLTDVSALAVRASYISLFYLISTANCTDFGFYLSCVVLSHSD